MKLVARIVLPLCFALAFASCGDEDEAPESAACASFLDEVEQCIATWCAADGAGNFYCDCFEGGAVVEAPAGEACSCGGSGSWRSTHRAVYCDDDILDSGAVQFDCAATTAEIDSVVTNRCG
jgi:hypothetical protein